MSSHRVDHASPAIFFQPQTKTQPTKKQDQTNKVAAAAIKQESSIKPSAGVPRKAAPGLPVSQAEIGNKLKELAPKPPPRPSLGKVIERDMEGKRLAATAQRAAPPKAKENTPLTLPNRPKPGDHVKNKENTEKAASAPQEKQPHVHITKPSHRPVMRNDPINPNPNARPTPPPRAPKS